MTYLVNSQVPITLVGGGPVEGRLLAQAVSLAPTVVAADGGVHRALDLGVSVDHVIGDMDSVDLAQVDGPQMHPIPDQFSTDLDKCLRSCDAPHFIGVGFLGGRLDHQMAACHSLVEASNRQVVLVGEEDLCFLAPFSLSLKLPVGTRFSLFPMGEVEGNSTGLKWPIHAYQFSPALMIGTSNETDAENVELTFDRRRMMVILPVEYLGEVVSQVFDG